MKRLWMMVFLLNLLLSACVPVAAPTPTPGATPLSVAVLAPTSTATPTATATPSPTPTDTATPSPTPTATPTPIPTLPPEQVGGLSGVPDPRVTNPQLFDLTRRDAPIPQFVNAMRRAGIEITGEQVLEGLRFIAINTTNDIQLSFIVASIDIEHIGKNFWLFIAIKNDKGSYEWQRVTPKVLTDIYGIYIGVMFGGWFLRDPSYMGSEYMNIPRESFNMVLDNSLLMQTGIEGGIHDLHRYANKFDFTISDLTFRYAVNNQKKLYFAPIISGNADIHIPTWIKDVNDKYEFMQALRKHVQTILEHYKGNGISYVLINEYFGNPFTNDPRTMFWYLKARQLGISDVEFVNFIFQAARSADSTARLIFNEYAMEIPGSYNYKPEKDRLIYNLMQKTIQSGTSVDAIGFQMHLYARDFVDGRRYSSLINGFREQIRKYRSLDLQVDITELDVRIDDLPYLSLSDRLRLQGEIYHDVIKCAIEEGINHIVIWGISDRDSWLNNPDITGQDSLESRPLLFDNDDDPKIAYYMAIQAIAENILSR